jgi:MoaA/NifB/PqqE/SkfB family radical SAM enzyme
MINKLKSANRKFLPGKLFYGPEWIVLGVNNVCNLHCKMCDVGTKNETTNFAQNLVGTHPLNMPLELFKRIVDQSVKFAPRAKLGYAFTEPLVYPHLAESLEYANQKGRFTSITTNALNLKKHAQTLSDTRLNELNISLDGLETTHNYIRGHKSSFQRAIEGIETVLSQEHPPQIGVYCVITNWNQHELVKFVEFFQQFPLKEIAFMHPNFTAQSLADHHNVNWGKDYPATSSNLDEFNPNDFDLNALWTELENVKKIKSRFPVYFSPNIGSKTQLDVFYNQPEKFIGNGCQDVFRHIMIKSDGSVIPAHGRCYNLTVGNLHDSELKDIWNSAIFSKFRKVLHKSGGYLPACSRCCSAF